MIKDILSQKTCAECRICCCFDRYDIWETPVISKSLADKITKDFNPQQKFIPKDDSFLFRMENEENGLFYCPMHSKTVGCILGDNKPFDCKIWPFRIMDFEGKRVITLSPVCPSLYTKPVSELMQTLKNGLAEVIFNEADKSPDIVKRYLDGYPILMVEAQK